VDWEVWQLEVVWRRWDWFYLVWIEWLIITVLSWERMFMVMQIRNKQKGNPVNKERRILKSEIK
jgi:hypothetical protein